MADHSLQAAPEAAIHPVLMLVDGKPTTTSLEVAAYFGKLHKNVLRDIRGLQRKLPAQSGLNFEPRFRTIAAGPNGGAMRRERFYVFTFDCFMLLTMGYSTSKALKIKVDYINEFNRMEAREQQARDQQRLALTQENAQLRLRLDDATVTAIGLEDELKQTQGALVKTQRKQIRLLERMIALQYRHSRKEAVHLAVDMERRGEPRDRIQAATGLNNNYLRQIVFRARAAGDLPPLADAAPPAQASLDLGEAANV